MTPHDLNKALCLLADVFGVPHEKNVAPDCFDLVDAKQRCSFNMLMPKNAEYIDVSTVFEDVDRGDHMLVRKAGSKERFHHGIYLGPKSFNGKTGVYVVDMHGSSKHDVKVRLRSITEFLRGDVELAAMRYENDKEDTRELSARLAERVLVDPENVHRIYYLLRGNCDYFATWCRTMRWVPSDVQAEAMACMQALKTIEATRRAPAKRVGKLADPIGFCTS